jgi:hypothetical protein
VVLINSMHIVHFQLAPVYTYSYNPSTPPSNILRVRPLIIPMSLPALPERLHLNPASAQTALRRRRRVSATSRHPKPPHDLRNSSRSNSPPACTPASPSSRSSSRSISCSRLSLESIECFSQVLICCVTCAPSAEDSLVPAETVSSSFPILGNRTHAPVIGFVVD